MMNDKSSGSAIASVTNEGSITQWIDPIREADSVAPVALWNRYYHRLVGFARKKLKHDFRQKRGSGQVRNESVLMQFDSQQQRAAIDQVVGSEPTPEFAADLAEEYQALLKQLGDETLCTVAKMEGYRNDEIAERLGVKTRTVERKLRIIRKIWSSEQ